MLSYVVCVLAVSITIALAASPSQFRATLTISNDPDIVGTLSGTLDYDFTGLRQQITYTTASISGFRDMILYNPADKTRYVICSSNCEAETHNRQQIRIHASGEAATSDTTCGAGGNRYTLNNAGVSTIYTTSAGYPCRVVFDDNTQWDLSGFADIPGTAFAVPSICPEKECKSQLDVMFVLDNSGSVQQSGFNNMKSFVRTMVDQMDISPQRAAVGLKKFGCTYDSTSVSSLTTCKSCVQNTVDNMVFGGYGCTCIACGQQAAMNELAKNGRYIGSTAVNRVQIVITDGFPNQGDTDTWAARSKSTAYLSQGGGATVFAIAVGSATGDAVLTTIASPNTATLQTKYNVNNFGSLATIVDSLAQAVCLDFGDSINCGNCKGFCGCGNPPTCHCADCDDGLKCTTDTCTASGCVNTPKTGAIDCNDNNACTADSCSESSGSADGCVHTDITCNAPDDCRIYSCNAQSGCISRARNNCSDGDPCTVDTCVSNGDGKFDYNTDCQHTVIPGDCASRCAGVTCPDLPCGINECDPSVFPAVCKFTDTCSENTTCTKHVCEDGQCVVKTFQDFSTGLCPYKGACYDYQCDETTGCSSSLWDEENICNDNLKCTIDACNNSYVWPDGFDKDADYVATRAMACSHTNRTCPFLDACSDIECNEVLGNETNGCYYPFKNCATEPSISVLLQGGCYDSVCTIAAGGCFLEQKADTVIDECGFCAGSAESGSCVYSDESTAAIGGLAIASIVVAVLALAVAFFLVAGTKGYDLIFKGQRSLAGAQANPTYDGGNLAGENPLYNANEN